MQTTETEPTTAITNVIVALKANNVQCLKAIAIYPNGSAITLKGRNASGKSSVLLSIWALLTGKQALPERPIRDGASSATAEADMGDFVITLKITSSSGTTLRIKAKSGQDITSPIAFLQSRVNELLLNPIGFVRLGETAEGQRKQLAILQKLVGLDFTALDAKRKGLYDQRTTEGTLLKSAQGKLAAHPWDPSAPKEPINVRALMEQVQEIEASGDLQLSAAQRVNTGNTATRKHLEDLKALVSTHDKSEADAKEEIDKLQQQLEQKRRALLVIEGNKAKAQLAIKDQTAIVEALVDVDERVIREGVAISKKPIQEQITTSGELNEKIDNNTTHQTLKVEAEGHQKKVDALTAQIEKIDQDKKDELANAKFPLPELSFDDTGILLNKLPLNQASQAQKLKAVVAMGFAMKPLIPVVLMPDASVLDEDTEGELIGLVKSHGGQIWLEKIASDDPRAIEICDGELVEA